MTQPNKGSFKKGEIRPSQGKRGPSKTTVMAREAIAKFADGNADRLQGWLDDVAADDKHGPAVAFKLLMDVMEYHLPKLARTESNVNVKASVVIQATTNDLNL